MGDTIGGLPFLRGDAPGAEGKEWVGNFDGIEKIVTKKATFEAFYFTTDQNQTFLVSEYALAFKGKVAKQSLLSKRVRLKAAGGKLFLTLL